jgi:hypothetical protein
MSTTTYPRIAFETSQAAELAAAELRKDGIYAEVYSLGALPGRGPVYGIQSRIGTEWRHSTEDMVARMRATGRRPTRVMRTSGLHATFYFADGSELRVIDGQAVSHVDVNACYAGRQYILQG